MKGCANRGGARGIAPLDVEALAPIAAKLESLPITPAEKAEALLVLLGVGVELSAAALGVSPDTVRARRRRIATRLGWPHGGEKRRKGEGAHELPPQPLPGRGAA